MEISIDVAKVRPGAEAVQAPPWRARPRDVALALEAQAGTWWLVAGRPACRRAAIRKAAAFAEEASLHPVFCAREAHMRRVTGIGGIFFKAKDPVALRAWYKDRLGIDVQDWGGAAFTWTDADGKPFAGTTAWTVFPAGGNQFAPSTASFMVNYRVADLRALLAALRAEGCNVLDKVEESDFGRFGWVLDPEGNKVELWEPPAGQ